MPRHIRLLSDASALLTIMAEAVATVVACLSITCIHHAEALLTYGQAPQHCSLTFAMPRWQNLANAQALRETLSFLKRKKVFFMLGNRKISGTPKHKVRKTAKQFWKPNS